MAKSLVPGGGPPLAPTTRSSGASITQTAYSGPLPPPEVLAQFEAVMQGASARIFAQWEKETEHRQSVQRNEDKLTELMVKSHVTYLGRGQLFGFLIAMSGLALSAYLVAAGNGIAGAVAGSIDIIGMVTLFLTGRRKSDDAGEDKKALERVDPPGRGK